MEIIANFMKMYNESKKCNKDLPFDETRSFGIQAICMCLVLLSVFSSNFLLAAKGDEVRVGESFDTVEKKAEGQRINFYAWGGSEQVNEHIRWASKIMRAGHDVIVRHVKVNDTAEVVAKLIAEKEQNAKRSDVDMVWINGENFKILKNEGLLFGPFTDMLPNMKKVSKDPPLVDFDFQTPIEGLETPWGRAQITFFYDSKLVSSPPISAPQLVKFAKRNKQRFTYPAPPDFTGTAFLKQLLYELLEKKDLDKLTKPVSKEDFIKISQPLWTYLGNLHPVLWRGGKAFPATAGEMQEMLENKEVFLTFGYNPNEAESRKLDGSFSNSVKSYGFAKGTIANAHFLAIPKLSTKKAASLVFINTLISTEAQKRKADPAKWGDPTVLDLNLLTPAERKGFSLSDGNSSIALREPHSSWTELLEKEWKSRFQR